VLFGLIGQKANLTACLLIRNAATKPLGHGSMRDMRSSYEDSRPPLAVGKPEERGYRLIYFIDNQTVDVWSDTITVITLP